jgi:hypothetical protein
MKTATLSAAVTAGLFALLIDVRPGACSTMPAREAADEPQPCSTSCLARVMADFKASVLARRTVDLAQGAEVRENMEITTIERSAWRDVKAVWSSAAFSDAVTANVVSRDGGEMGDGRLTNVSRNAVEGQGARTCVTANEGNKPWGPAPEQRFGQARSRAHDRLRNGQEAGAQLTLRIRPR